MKCFIFPQKFCVVYLVIKWSYKTLISFHSLNYWKLNFLVNKGNLLLKLKHVKMLCVHFLTNKVYIILVVVVCTFYWTNIYVEMSSKNPDFYFNRLPWIPLHLCVYDMRIVLLKSNGERLMKWFSEQFWRCCSCVYVLIETSHAL